MTRASGKARPFGSTRKLRRGRYQCRYWGNDDRRYTARRADGGPLTFETMQDARKFLAVKESEILRQAWLPPTTVKVKPVTFGDYASSWLAQRTLAPRTREGYRSKLKNHILPTFG